MRTTVERLFVVAVAVFMGAMVLATFGAAGDGLDADGDGLSDFREVHKYRTNPKSSDSDGDGKPDGEWDERREYSYTLRTVLRVLRPFNEAELCDDFQDGRVMARNDTYAEIEFVHYPYNTVNEEIGEDVAWRERHSDMTYLSKFGLAEYLRPGITTNWDEAMRGDMLAELSKDGIDVAKLSDRRVVEQVSRWVLKRCDERSNFNAFHYQYASGRPEVVKGRESSVRGDLGDPSWSFDDQAEHELLGRQMYFHRTRGTCTSSAVLLTTALRAVGIPTRIVLCTPLVDASTPGNVELVRKGVTHHGFRKMLLKALGRLGNSNASHTFNEVFVGGRWRRLNYERLGQGILVPGGLGVMTHVHTFNDLAEAGLDRWGGRGADAHFPGANSYAALDVSDRFGVHAGIANEPVAEDEPLRLRISKVYWLESPEVADCVRGSKFEKDGSGHLFLHAEKPEGDFDSAGDFKEFYEAVSKDFTLTAEGQANAAARAERGYWVDSKEDCREFYVRVAPDEMKKLKAGVAYLLKPAGGGEGKPAWEIVDGVTVVRRKPSGGAKAEADKKRTLEISKARWLDDATLPKNVRGNGFEEDGSGHLFLHADKAAWAKSADDFKAFYEAAPKRFRMTAKGEAEIEALAERGYWLDSNADCREFYVRVPAEEMKKIKRGVEYVLEPVSEEGDAEQWRIGEKVRVVRN